MRSLSLLQPIVHVFDYTCVGVTLDFRIPRSFIGKNGAYFIYWKSKLIINLMLIKKEHRLDVGRECTVFGITYY